LSSFWLALKQQWTIKISSPLFSIFSLAAILVGSRDHRTHFWKGAIQGSFHQSLVAIGPVVSEEKIKMWNVDGRRQTKRDNNSSHGLKARRVKKIYRLWKRHRVSWKGHRASLEKGQVVCPVKRTSLEHCPVQGCSRWISHKNEHTTDQNVLPYQGPQVFARFQLFNNVKITEQIVCSPKTPVL
jgi:hypothetical protein